MFPEILLQGPAWRLFGALFLGFKSDAVKFTPFVEKGFCGGGRSAR